MTTTRRQFFAALGALVVGAQATPSASPLCTTIAFDFPPPAVSWGTYQGAILWCDPPGPRDTYCLLPSEGVTWLSEQEAEGQPLRVTLT